MPLCVGCRCSYKLLNQRPGIPLQELVPKSEKLESPTEGVMFTVCVVVLGPLQPYAVVTVITEVPNHSAVQLTAPVAGVYKVALCKACIHQDYRHPAG